MGMSERFIAQIVAEREDIASGLPIDWSINLTEAAMSD